MNWQPIETAPLPAFDKDNWFMGGLRVLVWRPEFAEIARYSYTERGKGRWQNDTGQVVCPSHWMPLPPKPSN
jgi:hypothetical protein